MVEATPEEPLVNGNGVNHVDEQSERQKRVALILNSEEFRNELEAIINSQTANGETHPASLVALQQIADLLLPHAAKGAAAMTVSSGAPTTPIMDLKGVDMSKYVRGERYIRCKLAALYRLIDAEGWSHLVYNHISARVPGEGHDILINPFGLLYNEVSASSFIKVDCYGHVTDEGSSTFELNHAGLTLHTAIHQARPNVKCVLHLHTPEIQAISMLKDGLLPVCYEACVLGNISYHDFYGIINDESEKEIIASDLGAVNKVMILRNHGAVVCGNTIEETWQLTKCLMRAVSTQLKAMQAVNGKTDELNLISQEQAQEMHSNAFAAKEQEDGQPKWGFGEMDFEAKMRELDNKGVRTGYMYRQPLVKTPVKSKFDVEVPPTGTFAAAFSDSEEVRPTKGGGRYISATGYERVEMEVMSDGDTMPHTRVTWKECKKGEAVDISDAQFVKHSDNPSEIRNKVSDLKAMREKEENPPGYQSKILEDVTWEEAKKLNETGEIKIMGNARGIGIPGDEAHPFENVSRDDITKYERDADRRIKGLPTHHSSKNKFEEETPNVVVAKQQEAAVPPPSATITSSSSFLRKKQKDKKKKAGTLPANISSPISSPEGADQETGAESAAVTGVDTETEQTPDKKKKKSRTLSKLLGKKDKSK